MPVKDRPIKGEKNLVKSTNITVAVSDARIAGRTKVRLSNPLDPVFWYIKFNLELDPDSVSGKSMLVMEHNGYILDTDISYDVSRNLIIIKPIDPYEEEVFYLLLISRKVRSKRGSKLRRAIYVMFKIRDGRMDDYKILPESAATPKPVKKPLALKKEMASRAYTQAAHTKIDNTEKGKLPYGRIGINLLLVLLAIPVAIVGVAVDMTAMVYIGGALFVLGFFHIAVQMGNKKRRSAWTYNMGVLFFNIESFKAAEKRLKRAAKLDPMNELAEHGARKVAFYL